MLLLHLDLGLGWGGSFWEDRFPGEELCFVEISQLEPEIVTLLGWGLFGWGRFYYIDKITVVINSHQVTGRGLMSDSKNPG